MNKNENKEIYKNFKYSIEDALYEKITEDDFAEEFYFTVLEKVKEKDYLILNTFIKEILIIYPLLGVNVIQVSSINVIKKLITENTTLKKIFLKSINNQNITHAVDMLYMKNLLKCNLNDDTVLEIENILEKKSKSTNLVKFLKYEILKLLKKIVISENTAMFTIQLTKYLEKEINITIANEKSKFNIARFNDNNEVTTVNIIELQKKYIKIELIKWMTCGYSAESFWDRY